MNQWESVTQNNYYYVGERCIVNFDTVEFVRVGKKNNEVVAAHVYFEGRKDPLEVTHAKDASELYKIFLSMSK